jgi:NAD(P)-dependent dehydrogenase (short-subunit alcohol dehydrogenase family)
MKIADARAVVTGGASGLGLAVARHVASAGGRVTLLDVQEGPGSAAASSLGPNAGFAKCDVTSEEEVNTAMESARAAMGGINLLVNCAGVIGAGRVLGKNGPMAGDFFARVVHINLIGTFLCDKAAAAIMQHNPPSADGERGVIVHTSSVAAFEGQIGQAAYSASKGGVVGLTLPIARDFAQHKIRVNTIAPGLFHTPMFKALSDEAIASLGAQVPHPARLGNPEEYGSLASHIVANPMLNGETIRLDGAIRMAPR